MTAGEKLNRKQLDELALGDADGRVRIEDFPIEVGPDGVERLFGMTLEEHKALKREATPELMEWAEKAIAEHIARYGE